MPVRPKKSKWGANNTLFRHHKNIHIKYVPHRQQSVFRSISYWKILYAMDLNDVEGKKL